MKVFVSFIPELKSVFTKKLSGCRVLGVRLLGDSWSQRLKQPCSFCLIYSFKFAQILYTLSNIRFL